LIATAFPFGGATRICDVGGGNGALLEAILLRHAHPHGILVDDAGVLDLARARLARRAPGLLERVAFESMDMFARVPGGFIIGAVFALGLFGVGEERAVAMVTVVVTSSMLAVGVVGAFTLWRHGVALGELTTRRVPSDGPA